MPQVIYRAEGAVTIGGGASEASDTATVAITDTSKAILFYSTTGDSNAIETGAIRGEITSTTLLTFTRYTSSTTQVDVEYQVIEFDQDITVVRGTENTGATEVTVTVSLTDVAKSFLVLGGWDNSGTTYGNDDSLYGEIDSTTEISFHKQSAASNGTAGYQLVEFTGSADVDVQRGTIDFSNSASENVTVTAIVVADSFLLGQGSITASGTVMPDEVGYSGKVNSTTQINFSRNTSDASASTLSWELVEIQYTTGGVQSGENAFSTATDTATITAVDADTSVAYMCFSEAGYSGGKTSYSSTDNFGEFNKTIEFNSTTEVGFTSAVTGTTWTGGWFVVDWSIPSVTESIGATTFPFTAQAGPIIPWSTTLSAATFGYTPKTISIKDDFIEPIGATTFSILPRELTATAESIGPGTVGGTTRGRLRSRRTR